MEDSSQDQKKSIDPPSETKSYPENITPQANNTQKPKIFANMLRPKSSDLKIFPKVPKILCILAKIFAVILGIIVLYYIVNFVGAFIFNEEPNLNGVGLFIWLGCVVCIFVILSFVCISLIILAVAFIEFLFKRLKPIFAAFFLALILFILVLISCIKQLG